MKLENAKLIEKAAYDMGEEVELREKYSGRGMYGKQTAGVVGRLSNIVKSIAYAASELALNDHENDEDKLQDFIDDMGISIDNMGRSDVIVY